MKKALFILFVATAVSAAVAQTAIPTPAIPEAQPPAIAAAMPSDNAVAAPAQAQAASVNAVYGMSFKEAWGYGGWIMWVLLAISIFAVSLVIYFLIAFREAAVVPRRIVGVVREAIMAGDDNAARRTCDDHPGAFASIATTALDCVRATNSDNDSSLLRDIVQSEGARLSESMQSQAQLLLDLSAIAPMLGLLGTTLGMLQAFGSVAQDVMVAAKPVILAQGVSKAIITTIAGLLVSIPCMFAYAIFRRKVSRLAGQLEAAAAEVVTALIARKDAKR